MKTQLFPAEHVKEAAALIRKGGLVVFPTETVYGLGASAFNPVACARIFSAKGRPSDNPLIVHVSNEAQLAEVAAAFPPQAEALKKAFWPGPLSLIVPKNPNLPDIVTAGLPTVAVRWPRNSQTQAFLEECAVAVAAPSANVSGAPSPTNYEMAKGAMLGRVEGILAGEDCEEGLESTIVGFVEGQAKILRPGSITAGEIAAVLGCPAADLAYVPPTEGRPVSPGLKYTHYKPNAEVRLFRSAEELKATDVEGHKVGVLLVGDVSPVLPEGWDVLRYEDWKAYGRYLYSSFFELDRVGCTLILAQLPPSEGFGTAVANRLSKAAGVVLN
jgi:L-threonylcarbamoyladenylate synthase